MLTSYWRLTSANIRRLANKKAFEIIKEWLELCRAKRKLDFNIDSLIGNALHNALKNRVQTDATRHTEGKGIPQFTRP